MRALPFADFLHRGVVAAHQPHHVVAGGDLIPGLAVRARPKQLLLTHQLFFGKDDATLLEELRQGGWQGPAASGRDLEIW